MIELDDMYWDKDMMGYMLMRLKDKITMVM